MAVIPRFLRLEAIRRECWARAVEAKRAGKDLAAKRWEDEAERTGLRLELATRPCLPARIGQGC